MKGRPRVSCTATAKSTGERCRRAPIPGGNVCVMHGGGTARARAAGQRRLAEAKLQRQLTSWEKHEQVRRMALTPWSQEVSLRLPLSLVDPAELRRIANEMTRAARSLWAAAAELERPTRSTKSPIQEVRSTDV